VLPSEKVAMAANWPARYTGTIEGFAGLMAKEANDFTLTVV
jgi:hypothetical protein